MAGRRSNAVMEICREHSYPQFDCARGYLWICERLVQAEDRTEVSGRQVHGGRPSGRCER